MKAVQHLPAGYREIYAIDMNQDKKILIFINVLAVLIAVVMVVPMNRLVPISSLLSMEAGLTNYWLRFLVLTGSLFAYTGLHELVHGITMKAFGTKRVNYGFTGMCAFAGSNDYYSKGSYITIALAPVVVFLLVFSALSFLVPREWFWVVYLLQVSNIAGASGDIFFTVKFSKMPEDILVRDRGVSMTVYSKREI